MKKELSLKLMKETIMALTEQRAIKGGGRTEISPYGSTSQSSYQPQPKTRDARCQDRTIYTSSDGSVYKTIIDSSIIVN